MKFLITGANGFIGGWLCPELLRQGHTVRQAVRSLSAESAGFERSEVGPIDSGTDWTVALRGVEVVIHLAARVHVMKDHATDPLAEFRKVNLHGTVNLAQQAAAAGVKRLVFVSSVKVNGEQTSGAPFSELAPASPQDPYGISKWEAEQALQRVTQKTGLEVVVVRPPLIYGPGVKGNFITLLTTIDRGIPLPLAGVRNARSLVYLVNLGDALIVCATHPDAAGKTYLVSDGEDISTPDLLRRLGDALGRPARLFTLPPALVKQAGRLLGKAGQVERLFGSLQIDSGKIRRELKWIPPCSMQQGLQETAIWYRSQAGRGWV